MRYLKRIMLAALVAIAIAAFAGAGTASATTLEVGGSAKNEAVTITASLAGTSAILRDTFGFVADTCPQTHIHISANSPNGSEVTGPVEEMTISGCDNAVTVDNPGKLYVEWINGTNGRVYSEEAQWTVFSSIHGTYLSCTTGIGTPIGILTGAKEGHATIDVNATLTCGPHLHSAKWLATYTITSPTGLGVVS